MRSWVLWTVVILALGAAAGAAAGEGPAEEDPARYLEAVRRTKAYIRDGDIFQANLSRRWRGRLQAGVEQADIYRRLRASNPGPFAGIMRWGEHGVLSSSPERLLQVRGDMAQTRPIAGTRPRGADRRSDRALSSELIGHPKERAEHVMLIDLERNDLGRVCQPGSIEVSELMVVESYSHVHHIVSNVRGRLAPDAGPVEVMSAVFPGGTITGCPKVRCMEIIAALEQGPRGAYTGSFGYLNRDGSMDLNILIRTLLPLDLEVAGRHGFEHNLGSSLGVMAQGYQTVCAPKPIPRKLLRSARPVIVHPVRNGDVFLHRPDQVKLAILPLKQWG